VFGVRFRPAGFHPFLGAPVATLTDRTVAVADVLGRDGAALVDRLLSLDEEASMVALVHPAAASRTIPTRRTLAVLGRAPAGQGLEPSALRRPQRDLERATPATSCHRAAIHPRIRTPRIRTSRRQGMGCTGRDRRR
jgi:hypothetical protein